MFGGSAWSPLPDGSTSTCTCSRPSSRTSTGRTRWCRRTSSTTLRFWLAAGSTGSASTSRAGWPRTRRTPRSAAGVEHPHWDRPEVHDIYRSWRTVLGRRSRGRGGLGTARAHRGVRPARRAGPGVRVRHPAHPVVGRGPAPDRRRPARGAPRGRRPARVGGRQPRHRPRRHPARTRARAGPAPVPARPARRVLPLRRRRAGPARRRRAARAWQDPQSLRSGGRLPNRDGARVPLPVDLADRASASRRAPRGCRSPRPGPRYARDRAGGRPDLDLVGAAPGARGAVGPLDAPRT